MSTTFTGIIMDDSINKELISQLEENLKCSEQNWLVGAGISYDAKLPLMYPLTNRVKKLLEETHSDKYKDLIEPLIAELPDECHIEHILSHLGDYIALADRSKVKQVNINGSAVPKEDLEFIHNEILQIISDTIRSGYVEDKDGSVVEEGTPKSPIVCIKAHDRFIRTLFTHQHAGIHERRNPVNIFTTNYDTLIEDALALNRIPYWDGFSGGAVAYRTVSYGDNVPLNGYRAHLIKMHGSIDWFLCEKGLVWRIRANDNYPSSQKRVLIYPQSTKYIATQQDPFSTQFDLFRKALNSKNSNVLAVNGYSFGDEHINNEIEAAMSKQDNKTVLLAFVECKTSIPSSLEKWRKSAFGKRVMIATLHGLYIGAEGPHKRKDNDLWWTFEGMTNLLQNGCEV
jgi:hypothetical protein